MERPDQFAGSRVPGARITGGSGSAQRAAWTFAGAGTGDDQILVDGRGGQHGVGEMHARLHDLGCLEIDDAVLTEPGIERAVRSLDGEQPARDSPEDDRRRDGTVPWPIGEATLRRQV